jgi:hypothetical protein
MTDNGLDRESIDAKFERLRDATQSLRASPGFSARVLAAVELEATIGWMSGVGPAARRIVALAALAAAVAGFLATHDEERVNEAVAASFGEVEVDW